MPSRRSTGPTIDYDARMRATMKKTMATVPRIGTNPYESQLQAVISGMKNPYAGQNQELAQRLMQLGQKDYTQELMDLGNKQIDREKKAQAAGFGRLGMSELGVREDVQDAWTERSTDMATKAKIEAEALRQQGLQTAVQGINMMGGQELDFMMSKANAIMGGSDMWMGRQGMMMDRARMMMPLMEKFGMAGGYGEFKKSGGGGGYGEFKKSGGGGGGGGGPLGGNIY